MSNPNDGCQYERYYLVVFNKNIINLNFLWEHLCNPAPPKPQKWAPKNREKSAKKLGKKGALSPKIWGILENFFGGWGILLRSDFAINI